MTFTFGRILLAALMTLAGVLHFVIPKGYLRMMPRWLPSPLILVYVSGVCEMAGGIGLLIAPVARAAAWGLIALLVAVFPANVNMAVHRIGLNPKKPANPWILWGRLPLQIPLIYWAWLYAR